ncbi:uncharacterized protein LOC103524376 [Diaphorina citri]|uniref:Odorant receptor n=1 Tax=Diaphorina citri TaxID=121845 RepID=A0A1S4ESC1_DIACI|nr:uncharacterized protein LOC103524376 [Diaphorina citri]
MKFRLVDRTKAHIKSKIEAIFHANQNYPCLIFTTYLAQVFRFQSIASTKIRFLSLFNFACFQCVTLPLFLQLIFVSTKNVIVLSMQLFESIYCVSVCIEYGLQFISHKRNVSLLQSFHRIFIKNHKYVKRILTIEYVASTIITIILVILGSMWFLESTISTMTEEELQLTNRQNPDRKFKTEFFLPFDYSLSPYYELVWVVVVYYGVILQTILFETITTMPFITLHIKGQLDILAYYLRSIGNSHFVYTDIKEGTRVLLLPTVAAPSSSLYQSNIGIENYRPKSQYTKRLIVKIIRHHQKLMRIVDRYERHCQTVFGLRLLVTVLLMVALLCQLVFTDVSRGYICASMFVVLQFNYFLCTGSELIDSGVANIHRSVFNNLWYTCDSDVWKLLRPIVLVSQKPRHFKFMRFYIIDYRSFVSSLRVAYSLFIVFTKFS